MLIGFLLELEEVGFEFCAALCGEAADTAVASDYSMAGDFSPKADPGTGAYAGSGRITTIAVESSIVYL